MSIALDPMTSGVATLYEGKPTSYYTGARHDIVALLETEKDAAILELGCGDGATGRAVLAAGKAGHYVGIELNSSPAQCVALGLSKVIVGNVENICLEEYRDQFDALIISEVLEHLVDPWSTLGRLAVCLRPGGTVIASSPNVAHWRVIRELVRGRFRYQDAGVMDRTHLRWFTPDSYRALFETAGLEVVSLRPVNGLSMKARLLSLFLGRHLFMTQMMIIAKKI